MEFVWVTIAEKKAYHFHFPEQAKGVYRLGSPLKLLTFGEADLAEDFCTDSLDRTPPRSSALL